MVNEPNKYNRIELICQHCGNKFYGVHGKFCAPKCATKAWQKANPDRAKELSKAHKSKFKDHYNAYKRNKAPRQKKLKMCKNCGRQFETFLTHQIYCGVDCQKSAHWKITRKNQANDERRIVGILRAKTIRAIRSKNAKNNERHMEFLGCNIKQFMAHIESLWKPGMNWDNHSFTGWHIDHIKPTSSFDLSNQEQQKACFHYTNCQPLWAVENMIKNDLV